MSQLTTGYLITGTVIVLSLIGMISLIIDIIRSQQDKELYTIMPIDQAESYDANDWLDGLN